MKRMLLFLLLLCSLLATAQDDKAAPLLQADRDFAAATSARRLDGWMEYMTDETVLQRDKAVVGRESIRAALTPEWSNPEHKLTWSPTYGQMLESGTVGFTTGKWELHSVDGKGNKIGLKGNYITVWKKQKDGSWKVLWDGGAASGRLPE